MLTIQIIVFVTASIVAVISIMGLYPKLLGSWRFRFFPPVRFLINALIGLDKLQALNKKVTDKQGNVIKDNKSGDALRGEQGFDELLSVLKENRVVEVESGVDKIALVDKPAGVKIGVISPERVRFLALGEKGEYEILKTDPFDPNKPTREFKNWVEDTFRKKLARWMIASIIVWVIANSIMLYLLNK